MAVRTPLYNNSGNIQEMSTSQIQEIKDFCTLKFFTGNPVELQVSSGNGTIGSINDTRLQAGASSTSVSAFPSEATTAEPSVVTVASNNIKQVLATTPTLTNDTGNLYPCYYDSSSNIQPMNLQDMKDTFIHPVIDSIASTDNTTSQAGTYFISTSSSPGSNQSLVSATPVFSDTRANTGAYTAGGIGETLDQPTTISNYYLMKNTNGTIGSSLTQPIKLRSDNDLQEYPTSDFDSMIENLMVYTSLASADGYTLRYSLGTSTSNFTKGSGIIDTRLNGSGNYQTRFVNANDYRAQEFPNGTATTINTYYLRLIKA